LKNGDESVKYRYKPDGHRERGPVDEAALRQLVQAGRVEAHTALRPQRGAEWSTAGKLLPHLFAPPEGGAVTSAAIPWGRWELERPAPVASEKGAAVRQPPAWENSLGMKFLPVPGTEVQFSVWETRVQDYEVYAREQAGVDGEWKNPGFAQTDTHPVVKVSWEDAQLFCAWLTAKELGEGRLNARQSYRLPADWEWSVAVGLEEARAGRPKDKDGKKRECIHGGRDGRRRAGLATTVSR